MLGNRKLIIYLDEYAVAVDVPDASTVPVLFVHEDLQALALNKFEQHLFGLLAVRHRALRRIDAPAHSTLAGSGMKERAPDDDHNSQV
jgi:hypothetical protein